MMMLMLRMSILYILYKEGAWQYTTTSTAAFMHPCSYDLSSTTQIQIFFRYLKKI
jgi:hypothetical protein